MRAALFPLAMAAALLTVSACDEAPEAREQAAEVDLDRTMPVEPDGGIGNGAGPPAADAGAAANEESNGAATIPVAIQGRWGLTEADCDPTRSDNKGLLTVSDTKLEFYESVGTLKDVEERAPTRIRATFSFIGEGMSWERGVVLDAQDGGEKLIRREYGEDAAPGPFRYSKCA